MTTTTISYAELAKRLDNIYLLNKAPELDPTIYDYLENGNLYNCLCETKNCNNWIDAEHEKTEKDIFQWYLISSSDADYLKDHTDELVFYSNVLDKYIWGVTHFGTSWESVNLDFREE